MGALVADSSGLTYLLPELFSTSNSFAKCLISLIHRAEPFYPSQLSMPPESMSTDQTKTKKSKLEKIYELQASNKGLKEEIRILRKQLNNAQNGVASSSASNADDASTNSTNEEKLLEAMKALKRVTVKQEMSLNTIRSKAEQRRNQVVERDRKIDELLQEIEAYKEAQTARKLSSNDTDLGALRGKMDDLQLKCSEQENRNKMLSLQLETSEEKVKSLQKQLDSARILMERDPSSRSIKSAESSASEFDVAKMRRELANKIERIVLLEFDLEMCKEELHEIKQQRQMMHDAFPFQNVQANATGFSGDDFFSDDEDDDELWS